MSHFFVSQKSRRIALIVVTVLVGTAWQIAEGQHPKYIETTGYSGVLAAVSRLKSEGSKLDSASRQQLIAEGQAIITLEESYKQGTHSLMVEGDRADATSKALDDESSALATRKAQLEANPNRTQAEVDAFNAANANLNARLASHNSDINQLNSRIDADNKSLESSYASFVQRANAALDAVSNHGAVNSRQRTEISIDRIFVPSPEIVEKKYIHLDPQKWAAELKPAVEVSNKVLHEAQDFVREKAVEKINEEVGKIKNIVLENTVERLPNYGIYKSFYDQFRDLRKGYTEPTVGVLNSAFSDARTIVGPVGSDSAVGSELTDHFQETGEDADLRYRKLAGDMSKHGIKRAGNNDGRENAVTEAEDRRRVLPITKGSTDELSRRFFR